MGRGGPRAGTAAPGAQPVPPRHLPPGPHHPRRGDSRRTGVRKQALPDRDARRRGSPRRLRLGVRHRPGAHPRRVRGARGQPPRALGSELHARLPGCDQAQHAAALPAFPGPGRGAVQPAAARDAPVARAAAGERSQHRPAHSGRLQLGLLRARLPGPPDGYRTRRGTRPAGPQPAGVHAHDRRAAAGGRDLPAHRRRLHRPGHLPRGLGARGARALPRLPGGPGGDCERPRDRRGRRQGRLCLRAAHHQVLPGRRIAHQAHPDHALPGAGGARLHPRQSRQAGREDGGRVRRLRDAGRSPCLGNRTERVRGGAPGKPGQLHLPADARPFPGPLSRRGPYRAAARGPPAVHPAVGPDGDRPRRPLPGRAQEGQPGRELQPGRRLQGRLDRGRPEAAEADD